MQKKKDGTSIDDKSTVWRHAHDMQQVQSSKDYLVISIGPGARVSPQAAPREACSPIPCRLLFSMLCLLNRSYFHTRPKHITDTLALDDWVAMPVHDPHRKLVL